MSKSTFLINFLSKPHISQLFDKFEKQDFSKKRNVNNLPDWVLDSFVSDAKQKEYVKYHMGIKNIDRYFILTYFDQIKKIKKISYRHLLI
jgi:predicted HD phosphohydrolase